MSGLIDDPWPADEAGFAARQLELGRREALEERWRPVTSAAEALAAGRLSVGSVFVAFPTGSPGPGAAGQRAWAAAVLAAGPAGARLAGETVIAGATGAPYVAGLLGRRCGRLMERALRDLPRAPDVLLVDATGRDHPRGAGLALHLGAVLGLPTVGVTARELVAAGDDPGPERGDLAPLLLAGRLVGYRVRVRPGTRALLAHAGWRTDPDVAAELVLALTGRRRTPLPLRAARTLARTARACDEGRLPV
ncbi:MAG: endonuclease V [Thermoleophilia bacterium]|jgi:deoxyribonuclease V|nr:endonuclease V [Thermoleophilia bacterium]